MPTTLTLAVPAFGGKADMAQIVTANDPKRTLLVQTGTTPCPEPRAGGHETAGAIKSLRSRRAMR